MRLRPCIACGHMHGSHYIVGARTGRHARTGSNPRGRSAPLPCHITGCTCQAFLGVGPELRCAICERSYTTQSSLQNHLYARHPGLNDRERSEIVAAAILPEKSPSPWHFEASRRLDSDLRDLEELVKAPAGASSPSRNRRRSARPP